MTPTLAPIPAGLSPSRAADRVRIARLLAEVAKQHGASVQEDREPDEVTVRVTHGALPRQLCGLIWIDRGQPRRTGFCVHWHTPPGAARLALGGLPNVNPHHQGKATSWALSVEALRDELARCLALAQDGRAWE